MSDTDRKAAERILAEWGVQPTEDRDWQAEIRQRVAFLCDALRSAGRSALVLGISGGVDSTVTGKLCQLAADEMRNTDPAAQFIAVRLPYGTQADEEDAQAALQFIAPDRIMTVDIKASVDALHAAVMVNAEDVDPAAADFERGNVKARVRMAAQYQIAGLHQGLVVGTDHNAEAVTGFFTKWGDGACDLLPLRGLNKRQVRRLASALGANDELAHKQATADLEDLRPLHADEAALGMSYDVIDDFLEFKGGTEEQVRQLVAQYQKTQHKRCDPPAVMGAFRPDSSD
ncbi:ammonia-dependent NAD(+) synthetase [Marinobacter sp. X15-166B]|uniref:ammonia-dependent NAD(+) synthetase n=1 Tax=Marinobacter sp. X15-166B TaxID=1897620 RepID=UPI00085C1BE1|nr:ammonia-dependent NAD(+) synthetase [Marinobacter sp. X15-166B]OEY67667.1 NAD(+) synthase [Marinobacter sp. X15-166B]